MTNIELFCFAIFLSFQFGSTSNVSKIWDGLSDLIIGDSEKDQGCYNITIKINDPNFYMCLRQNSDVVSDIIRQRGSWAECNPLLLLWNHGNHLNNSIVKNDSIFVDVGANIGSCSLLMASAGIKVLSFEPLPSNLYYFTRSIKTNIALGVFPVDRMKIFPYGLGNKSETLTIYSQGGNLGNSVINKPVADFDNQISAMQNNNKTINVIRLDDLLWPDMQLPPPDIKLMKIDIQGFEIQMLHGAHNLLKARCIKTIKTELAGKWLQAQGESALNLCILLREYGFEIFKDHQMKHPAANSYCAYWDKKKSVSPDIIAHLF